MEEFVLLQAKHLQKINTRQKTSLKNSPTQKTHLPFLQKLQKANPDNLETVNCGIGVYIANDKLNT